MTKLMLTLPALALAACQSDYIPDRPSEDRALVTVIDEWVIDPPVVIDPPIDVLPPPVVLPLDVLPPPESIDVTPVVGGGPELGGV